MNILVTTAPSSKFDRTPFDLLTVAGCPFDLNPYGRKLTEDELAGMIAPYSILIAGTERISRKVLLAAENLKFIARVGIGLDGIDLGACRERGIEVSYTPDAPAPAVAELTVGLILTLLRRVNVADREMHGRVWVRHFGRRLEGLTVGIIGVGRIGSRVIKYLDQFRPARILVNDIKAVPDSFSQLVTIASKERIYQESDVLSLHLPHTDATHNLIGAAQLRMMKSDAVLINTARGGIVNEDDLYQALATNQIGGAAVDVYYNEPYSGPLCELDNCLLTCHMGSMSLDCRAAMEIEATREALRFASGQPRISNIPSTEYK